MIHVDGHAGGLRAPEFRESRQPARVHGQSLEIKMKPARLSSIIPSGWPRSNCKANHVQMTVQYGSHMAL